MERVEGRVRGGTTCMWGFLHRLDGRFGCRYRVGTSGIVERVEGRDQ